MGGSLHQHLSLGRPTSKTSTVLVRIRTSADTTKHSRLLSRVVSDGAGSASKSEVGSRLACSLVHDEIARAEADHLFTRAFALSTLEVLRLELTKEATEAGLRVREYACTLLVAIVATDRAAFWQIGDGAICFRTAAE